MVSTPAASAADQAPHPSGDERFKLLDAALKRHHYQQDALIEVLHTAQELFGYLRTDLLLYLAHGLRLSPSRVYGVATFYHLFTLAPKGEHTCSVCTGTACYVKGAEGILVAIEQATGAHPG
jgi:bidirectional [NiFe] hydrogenase diaphorase subunit